ncbi:hypothetical protein L596_026595 [Steinernema carpocapsae]|uniref:Uncharacterized protein n=1 Tax=Steinernema carpocapsae TaxID=34508 RepID=A0A4U5M1U5_STECR|nr:hypothetical protein L596_026595 [Steinernema carpocapsae]
MLRKGTSTTTTGRHEGKGYRARETTIRYYHKAGSSHRNGHTTHNVCSRRGCTSCEQPRDPPDPIGPILFGGLGSPGRKSSITCTATTETRPVDLEKLWTMESGVEEFHGPSKTEKKSVNDKVVEQFEKDIRFSPEGYVIKLPWKTDGTKEKLPDNRPIAFKRLFATLKKYKNNEWVMEKYKETIEDQLKKGSSKKSISTFLLQVMSYIT